jgi:acyl carrier protein
MSEMDKELKAIIMTYASMERAPAEPGDDTNIFNAYSLDSIKIINVVADIEMCFGIEIAMDDRLIDVLRNYGKLRAYIREKIEAKRK